MDAPLPRRYNERECNECEPSSGPPRRDQPVRLPQLLPGQVVRRDRAGHLPAAPVQVQGGRGPLGDRDELGRDPVPRGRAGDAGAGGADPPSPQRDPAAAVPGRDGGRAAAHKNVRWLHDVLPERGVVQRVHRPHTPHQKREARPHPRPLQPLLPDAVVLQQAGVCGAVVRQGVDGAAGRPGRGQLPGHVRGLHGGDEGVLRPATPDLHQRATARAQHARRAHAAVAATPRARGEA
jgi:hypothetical protein